MYAMSFPVAEARSLKQVVAGAISIMVLASVHFFGFVLCFTRETFSGPWFPFRWSPAADHSLWQAAVRILEFPLASPFRLVGAVESSLYPFVVMLNSFLWALIIYKVGQRLLRRVTT